MADERLTVRPFRESDRESELRTGRRLDPLWSISVEEARRWDEVVSQPPYVLRKWVAESGRGSVPIGFASLRSDPEGYEPSTFWVDVAVDPDHQRHGIGTALASTVLAEARARGARRLWASARADQAASVRFLLAQGFAEERRTWRSTLEVASATPLPDRTASLAAAGVLVTTLAAEGPSREDVRRLVYAVCAESSADEPRPGTYTPLSYEQFCAVELDSPAALPDGCLLAKAGGRFVAFSAVRKEDSDAKALHQTYTGTLREFRGRGIASELKRRTVEYARSHGYREIRTGNDSLNGPMLAINRKLGFRFRYERIVGERRLPP